MEMNVRSSPWVLIDIRLHVLCSSGSYKTSTTCPKSYAAEACLKQHYKTHKCLCRSFFMLYAGTHVTSCLRVFKCKQNVCIRVSSWCFFFVTCCNSHSVFCYLCLCIQASQVNPYPSHVQILIRYVCTLGSWSIPKLCTLQLSLLQLASG